MTLNASYYNGLTNQLTTCIMYRSSSIRTSMFVSGMLYLVYVLLGSKVNVISIGQAVGITFAVTAVVVLVVGVIIGSLATYCVMP